MEQDTQNIVEMKHITMRFGNIVANDDIHLAVKHNEVHALIGENGAGKSTLMSILFGIYKPTAGYINIKGLTRKIKDPNNATKLGLGMVHQHFKLVGIYNAVQNIILGKEPHKIGFIEYQKAKKKIQELSEKYKLNLDLKKPVKDLSVGMQQRVEILKMLYTDADILIFDEPTAVLTPQEITGFLKMVKDFQKKGKTVLIITHKLEEIKEVADSATIIRLGKVVAEIDVKKTTVKKMASLMVGRSLVKIKNQAKSVNKNATLFSVSNLNVKKQGSRKLALNNVSFDIKAGEVLALAGVEGNGQSQLAQAIAGLIKIKSGTITLDGEKISHTAIKNRYDAGLSFIPEDRHKHGLILDMKISDNMISRSFKNPPFSYFGLLNQKKLNMFSKSVIGKYDVRGAAQGSSTTRSLSGGNQQKAIVGRELTIKHKLLLAVQPTRGLDLGAIEFIHKNILQEKTWGNGVLLISYELDEILSLADRIIVINDGVITGEIDAKKATKAQIGQLMARRVN